MRATVLSAGVLALGVGLVQGPAQTPARAATVTADSSVDVTLGIDAPDSVDVSIGGFDPLTEIDRSGSGVGGASPGILAGATEVTLTPTTEARAGPGIGEATTRARSRSRIVLTNTSSDPVDVGLSLSGAFSAATKLENPDVDLVAWQTRIFLTSTPLDGVSAIVESWTRTKFFGQEVTGDGDFDGFETSLTLDGNEVLNDIRIDATSEAGAQAVIPLPAGLPLLLAGLGALALLRRRRA